MGKDSRSPPSFETLPPEVETNIFLNLDPESIHSLIRASPRMLQVFLSHRHKILTTLCYGGFDLAVIPDAVAVVRVYEVGMPDVPTHRHLTDNGSIRDPGSDDDSPMLSNSVWYNSIVRPELLKYHASRSSQYRLRILPTSTSDKLSNLCNIVNYFVTDFAHLKLRKLKQYATISGTREDKALELDNICISRAEKSRIARAFLRLEYYVYIFRARFHEQNSLSAPQRRDVFFQRYPPWEIEEIVCVRDYLFSKLEGVIEELEELFVCTNSGSDEDGVAGSWRRPLKCPTCTRTPSNLFGLACTAKFSTWHKVMLHTRWMDRLCCAGLKDLRIIFLAKLDIRNHYLHENDHIVGFFLSDTLSLPPMPSGNSITEEESQAVMRGDASAPFTEDNLKQRNEAWIWSHDNKPSVEWGTSRALPFRDWGYVFWDSKRLRASGISTYNVNEVIEKWDFKIRPPWEEPSGTELLNDCWDSNRRRDHRAADSLGLLPREWKERRKGEMGVVDVKGYNWVI
jgi:hypothetical protein